MTNLFIKFVKFKYFKTMNKKTFKLVNNKEKSKIVFFGEFDFDFTKYITHVKIIVDKLEKFDLRVEQEIIKNNQFQKSVFETPTIDGHDILVEIQANFDLELIKIKLDNMEDYKENFTK